jgi:N-succinyldiaminopimelate aminotransferase
VRQDVPVDDALTPRLQPYRSTVFGEMSALAARLGAVNLGQGFPDTDGPRALLEAAARNILDGVGNQYPPAHGLPALRAAVAEHQQRWYGLEVDADRGVVVATGASEALAAAVLALVDPGSEVLLLEPFFDLYPPIVAMAGATPVPVPPGADYRLDPAALRAAITPRTRMIIANSPNNPSGQVWTHQERAAVAAIAAQHDLLVLSDEAYEHLWFDGHEHVPLAALPGMFERTVTVGSGGKCFSLTGWKVGWATGPEHLISAVRVVRQHLSYVSAGPFQPVIAHGLGMPDDYFEGLRTTMQRSGRRLADGLARLGFAVLPVEGTYFATTDVRPLGFLDGAEFCAWAPHEAGVVAIPHSALCASGAGDPYVRWAFCKQDGTIDAALQRLRAALARRGPR